MTTEAPTPAATTGTPPASDTKAPKDKNCPFCGQAFTSSSLGRHLDLYIRAKNPKPPDGVHLVEEIKKIRGGITRRQKVRKELHTPAKRESMVSNASPAGQSAHDDDDDDDDGGGGSPEVSSATHGQFKDVSWAGGGAGDGHTPRAPEVRRRDVSRQLQKVDLEQRQRLSDEAETAKATELALRELLRRVKEANAKATGPALFDFDPYTLNFPSLCLHILPPPPTLFSPTPFASSESWSISPPGQKQLEALNRQVGERLLAHQRQRQINQAYPSGPPSAPSSASNSPLPSPPLFDPDPQKLFCHIADAYNNWSCQPEKVRQECWQVEILRSYARASDMRRDAEMTLENARREIDHLKSSRWAAGGPERSPIIFTLGAETVKELGKHGMDLRNWDYDRLIEKWKTVVRDKHAVGGLAAQKPLPDPSATRSCSMASMPPQPFVPINVLKTEHTPYSAPATISGTDAGSDQVDAEGEDDDADVDLEVVPASNNANPNAPLTTQLSSLPRLLPLQPTPVHPNNIPTHDHLQSQVHAAQAHAQARAQAQAQAQAWAAARQHMNQSRNQQHHQLSPHPSHMGSATNSRRESAVMMDPHAMSAGGMIPMDALPMDGIETGPNQFLRMDMGMGVPAGFVGSNDNGV
ncbi:hypothetical protein BU23DRAFT_242010 [Bimuria novae-zelandiae CBS 107.79]|uniref:Uncharacterized protein n=1 Tax=Bimuria novae-zelandiae CBS 107.79 TaxID=1447943 RepID=A0A6A5UZQ5_9PLEO|nr:hypothetical protein BU23DRAFT_242010 [Bimuria novae-zelandiae CBS 107.79]